MCEKGPAVPPRLASAAALASALAALSAAIACAALGGCGTRTGLLLDDGANGQSGEGDGTEGADAALGDAGDAGAADVDAGVHCALNIGPVSSCDAGASGGPVQLCTGKFAACVRVFQPDSGVPVGDWGCCMANPPENVPQCQERQFFDAGCF
jgi:hypothetical protein